MPQLIFLVEDHPAMREAYASVLTREPGLKVCGVAETAEAALDVLAGAPCDLVVTDVRLPGMNGIELTARLRALRPSLPVLVITGHEDGAFDRRAREAGARAFLPKRLAARDLVPTIH